MMKQVTNVIKSEKGIALSIALVLLALGGLVLTPLLFRLYTGVSSGQIYRERIELNYAVDAGVYYAGSAVNWTKQLGLFSDFSDINHFDKPCAISRKLVFVPALSGLACPYWDRSAAGLWLGMSLEVTKDDLCQSVLEGVALRTAQVLEAIFHLTGKQTRISVDGGLINNSYFCQFLADVTQREIIIPASPDITPYGTGRFALIGSGLVKRTADLPAAGEPRAVIIPRADLTHLKARFDDAIARSKSWR